MLFESFGIRDMLDAIPELPRDIVAGGGSTAIVSAILNPTDVIKTRRQIGMPRSARAEVVRILGAEGIRGLWLPGLHASVLREILYSGCTKGFYPQIRAAIAGDAEPVLWQRALAASVTGFAGSFPANAMDVVKIRQFDNPNRYSGVGAAVRDIASTEGIVSGLLVRGVSASAPRGAAIAIGEVTTYDQTKVILRSYSMFTPDSLGREPMSLHVVTSIITGFVATTVAAPFDTLKSRVMADDGKLYRGFVSALSTISRQEGPLALFRGWFPAYCRLAPHAIMTFPLVEQARIALGLRNF
eukprot:TRINITY_DN51527_c0_g1_i1.p1 TRINITY_DN51527_c0_g1~~TRINITY_DN51527_c0_g1_i1.p1  ORF type:complete len:299 (-),score=26.76 TRINITY_DN51527_c0_g1_i1:138-1034(-)